LLAFGAAVASGLGAGLLVVLGFAAAAFWLGAHALRRGPALAAASRAWAGIGLAVALGAVGWSAIERAEVTVGARRPGRVEAPALASAAARWRPGAGARVGDRKANPKDGAALMWVPAGEFTMGSDDGGGDERPQRRVHLDGYWMYKHEVTVAQYRRFCSDTGRDMPAPPSWGWKDDHPVVNVTWDDAKAYADWAGVSLPTEAQWEKAARGTGGREYPWGNTFQASKAVCSVGLSRSSTAPVGSIPSGASPCGCLDMAGNVWEWCADWYDSAYYARAPHRNPENRQASPYRVLRGGSWYYVNPSNYLRAADRDFGMPVFRNDGGGFRCSAGP